VWENFAEAMQQKGKQVTGLKKIISGFMKGKCAGVHEALQVSSTTNKPFLGDFAMGFMRKKAHSAIGLDQARVCLTGAAPIMKHTLDYFGSIGIHILEVYGMSENTGPQNVCKTDYFKAGSCGIPIPGTEIKLDNVKGRDKEGEGEVCFRGRHVMIGYLNNLEKTKESIDSDGWLHSGDVGFIDQATNLLYITGRIKELIITAGGENIAPVPVEDAIKAHCPALSNVMMIGDKRKYNTLLVTLRQVPDGAEGFTENLFGASLEVNPDVKTVSQAQSDASWTDYIQAGIDNYNKNAVSNAQKVQKFKILKTDFSVDGGELTSTQKLKRNIVTEKYKSEIDSMY
jgi:long-chain-fatty-acid--CoA ligase ACSBG